MPRSARLIRTSTTISSVQAGLGTHFLHMAHQFNSIHLCYLYLWDGVKTSACLVKFTADDLKENTVFDLITAPCA